MHAKVFAATTIGVDAHLVEVEADIAPGIPQFYIVGLPDTAIKESNKRIQTALKNTGYRFPGKKFTINLAPADVKKEGTLFDLPITIGILLAAQEITVSHDFLEETLFLGELSLDGTIRFIKGALPIAYDASRLNKKRIIVPKANVHEAALIKDIEVIGVSHLTELVSYLRGECLIEPTRHSATHGERAAQELDFAEVRGQELAKRALTIAAAGRHNILFIGPPGAGKTMLAKRLQTIMPPMTFDEILETSKIYSVRGQLAATPLITQRPFRDPHHTISQPGLIGGGSYPQPGEISLAHNGILFLDELTEFKRTTLEVLRQPLEHKTVSISRVSHTAQFPASFLLVAALNPCPCGFLGDAKRTCSCGHQQITRYLEKLSGPLLDRIDLQVTVQSVAYENITAHATPTLTSAQMLAQVEKAVARQQARFNTDTLFNAMMTPTMIDQHCTRTPAAEAIIQKAFEKLHLSMRGYHKIIKIARTIADLEGSDIIDTPHIQEAIMYRSLDQTLERHRG